MLTVNKLPVPAVAIAFSFVNSYRKISNISRTKFQNLSDSRPGLQLSLPNLLKPCVKSKMKM